MTKDVYGKRLSEGAVQIVDAIGHAVSGVTSITINGVAVTSFRIVSATSIQNIVPTGATTGLIAVTTANGTATSTGTFTVA